MVGLAASSPLVYQSAYLTEELDEILSLIQNRMNSLGMGGCSGVVANAAVREKLTAMEKKSAGDAEEEEEEDTKLKRKEIDGVDCPICFDSLGGSGNIANLTFCKSVCGTNFHKECIRMWTSQHRSNPTCPACRQQWTDVGTGGKGSPNTKRGAGEVNREGYINLGGLQGQSPVRDTSTYNEYSGWYGYKRRRY